MGKKVSKVRALPMPLWLQSFYAFLRILVIMAAVVAFPRILALTTESGNDVNLQQLKFIGSIFLASLGVPLHIFTEQAASGPGARNATDAVGMGEAPIVASFTPQGNFSLIPLTMTIVSILLSRRAGYLLTRAAPTRRMWHVVCGWFACVAGVSALVSWLSDMETARTSLGASAIIPLLPTGFGLWWGFKKRKGYWLKFPATPKWKMKIQGRRGLDSYVNSIIKSNFMCLSLVLCMSAAVLAVGFCLRWADMAGSFQLLDAGWAGDLEFFIVQMMYLPNVIIMAASWLSGAGVYLGNTALVTPSGGGDATALLIPILQVVPERLGWLGLAAPVFFIAAGFAVGRWFWLHAENYVDEVFDMLLSKRFVSLTISGVVNAVTIAGSAAMVMLLMGWLGSGELGHPGAYYGAHLPWFGVWSVVTLGGGIFLGQATSALIEHYQLRSVKGESDGLGKKRVNLSTKEIQ